MGKGWCVDGQLDTTLYNSPIPLIGLYIAVAASVCFLCMTFDLMYGLFIRTKPFLPCKLFPMNAFTLTVLAVATKIPNDLVTQMPRVEDQLSKLISTALLCTALGYYMPSLGAMATSERYSNLAALTVMVITLVINVCIQMHTGVIFDFIPEHIIMMACMFVLLLFMWSSAIALRGQIDYARFVARPVLHDFREKVKDSKNLKNLANLIGTVYANSYKGGQTLLCISPNHHTIALLSVLSLAVVLQSLLRSFVLNSLKSCGTSASDYQWSILIVIVAQTLTIVVGSISIIHRWLSLLFRFNKNFVLFDGPTMELEFLKLKLSTLSFLNKSLTNILIYVLMGFQIILYQCNILFVALPICYVKKLLEFVIRHIFHGSMDDIARNTLRDAKGAWMIEMSLKELERYHKSWMRDCPIRLIALISKCVGDISSSKCKSFISELEAAGKEFFGTTKEMVMITYNYRFSCVSMLVLSGILAELMPPSPRRERLMQSLKESFEIIYFVDQKTHTPDLDNERRWTSTIEVWANWENPSHWFRTKILGALKIIKPDDLGVLGGTQDAINTYFKETQNGIQNLGYAHTLTDQHMGLVSIEFAVICKFIRKQRCESDDEDLFQFLEMCFVKMLCFTLFSLPSAILKEMDVDDPNEIGEERIRKALKFCHKLGFLLDKIGRSEFDHIAADDDGTIPKINDDNV